MTVHKRFKILTICLVAILALAGTASRELRAETGQQKAASPAMQNIQKLLAEGRSPSRDDQLYTAAVLLHKAIEAGQEPTQSRDTMAKALYEVAQGGHAFAWADYGRCLWNGWGVPENREEALAAYKRSGDLGSAEGAYIAAYNLYWTFKRYDEAYAYAQKALRGEDPKGDLRYLLGLMAYNGRGRPKDIPESMRLHQEAAERGNADAYFELFVYAMQGIGDRSKAVFYLKQAAERDQPRACANLGALYATGQLGFPKDLHESIRWYKRAADLGNGQANATLGVMALTGEGMPKDETAGWLYLKRAEDLGIDVVEYLHASGAGGSRKKDAK